MMGQRRSRRVVPEVEPEAACDVEMELYIDSNFE